MKNLVIESLKAVTCKRCGASNNAKESKHMAFTAKGFHWCGHCGGKLETHRAESAAKERRLQDKVESLRALPHLESGQ